MQDALCARDSAEAPTLTGPLQNEESEESMPTLTDEIKAFIVRDLARFDRPSEVAEAVKSTFGVELGRRHVYAYDPRCTQPPAPRWCDLHAAIRAAFLQDAAAIGVVHKIVRLRMLDRMAHRSPDCDPPTPLRRNDAVQRPSDCPHGKLYPGPISAGSEPASPAS